MSQQTNLVCPCGSGLAQNKCCKSHKTASNISLLNGKVSRIAKGELIDAMYRHADEVFGKSAMSEAWEEFNLWNENQYGEPEVSIMQIFGPFFLFSWEIDPGYTDCNLELEGKTVAESYVSAHSKKLSKSDIDFIKAANRPAFSFYEVGEVIKGKGFLLFDLLSQESYVVQEKLGSEQVHPGCIIYAAVMKFDGHHELLAVGKVVMPPMVKSVVIEFRTELLEESRVKQIKKSDLLDLAFEIREFYLTCEESMLNPELPELTNADGDPLLPQVLHFDIDDPKIAFERLRSLVEISEEELKSGLVYKEGRLVGAEIPYFKKSKPGSDQRFRSVFAMIKISGTKLLVEVDSDNRASVMKKKITAAMGSHAKFKVKVLEDIESKMPEPFKAGKSASAQKDISNLPPGSLDALAQFAEQHWEMWFHEKIPALHNMTPIQASKSKEGRRLLESLLNYYEQSSSQSNSLTDIFQPDVAKLRSKLGLQTKNN